MKSRDNRQARKVEVHEVRSDADLEEIFKIRDAVFVVEQRLTSDARHDPDDRRSIHYLAYSDGLPVGTGRLTVLGAEAQIAWVAVLEPYRGRGIGWALMKAMNQRARDERSDYVILNAQVYALDFYCRLGYEAVGNIFKMSAIPHQVMILSLTPGGGKTVSEYFNRYNRGQVSR